MTALPSTPAGVSRPTNLPNARFDLVAAAPVRSGSSTDPLGQVPVPTLNRQQQVTQARGARLEKTSLDTLGERPTASPLVNPAGELGWLGYRD